MVGGIAKKFKAAESKFLFDFLKALRTTLNHSAVPDAVLKDCKLDWWMQEPADVDEEEVDAEAEDEEGEEEEKPSSSSSSSTSSESPQPTACKKRPAAAAPLAEAAACKTSKKAAAAPRAEAAADSQMWESIGDHTDGLGWHEDEEWWERASEETSFGDDEV